MAKAKSSPAPAAPAEAPVTLPAVKPADGFNAPSPYAAFGHLDYADPDD